VGHDGGMEWYLERVAAAPLGRLGTSNGLGNVHLVPVCFALLDDRVVSAVDHKPKRTTRLQRLIDMERTGHAVLLVDHYEEDWSKLWWVRVSGPAVVHSPTDAIDALARAALVAKYRQYQEVRPAGPVWSIGLDEIQWWSAAGPEGPM
jgi:PPOX class probable F420-dependent enzyme